MSDEQEASRVPHDDDWTMTLGGLHVVRSICNLQPKAADGVNPDFSIWSGAMGGSEDGAIPLLVGQIMMTNVANTHLLGVTAAAVCQPGPDLQLNPLDDDEADAFLGQWGYWVSHSLWDYCASHLRMLASGLMESELELPAVTPVPRLVYAADMESPEADPGDNAASNV